MPLGLRFDIYVSFNAGPNAEKVDRMAILVSGPDGFQRVLEIPKLKSGKLSRAKISSDLSHCKIDNAFRNYQLCLQELETRLRRQFLEHL